jgi:4-amino-4-deoxy-L-arabinose transferase-like glycosyltransferase
VSRSEVAWILSLTAVALLLRWSEIGRVALSHFDEGVYMLWGLAGDYPAKAYFAPPLLPGLIRIVCGILGPDEIWARMSVGLFGAASIPILWLVSRRWFGPAAAAAAASLATFSEYHIAFCRLVLTDVPFTFWFIASIALAYESLRQCTATPRQSSAWRIFVTLAAGTAAGAALNTKYNGSLALIVPAFALGCELTLRTGIPVADRFRHVRQLLIIAAIAALLYAPWFWAVHSTVGYGDLLRHHRGYSSTIEQWPANLMAMLSNAWYLNRGMGAIGASIGMLSGFACSRARMSATILVVVAAAGYLLDDGVGWMLGPLGLLYGIRNRNSSAIWCAVWLGILVLITPMYRPYARLMLPLIAGGWLAFGALVQCVVGMASVADPREMRFTWVLAWLALVVGAAISYSVHGRSDRSPSDGEPSLRIASERLFRLLPEPHRVAAFVRPPALFYARVYAGDRVIGPLNPSDSDALRSWLDEPTGPEFLFVDESLLRDNVALSTQLGAEHDRMQEVARFKYRPADAVVLDDRLAAPPSANIETAYQLVLYRRR